MMYFPHLQRQHHQWVQPPRRIVQEKSRYGQCSMGMSDAAVAAEIRGTLGANVSGPAAGSSASAGFPESLVANLGAGANKGLGRPFGRA
ncbi:Transcription factor vib-1 [Fusarium oxysporum f. sp. albedinis]|nr:Transcription factor vib-1 [Fusarium oxysporum f. sp. albedinis]